MQRLLPAMALGLALTVFPLADASAAEPKVEHRFNATQLWFEGGNNFTGATLTVNGPNGYMEVFSADRGLPVFRTAGGGLGDGMYFYELSAASDEQIPVDNNLDNGRGEAAKDTMAKPFSLSGSFELLRGAIIAPPAAADGGTGADIDSE